MKRFVALAVLLAFISGGQTPAQAAVTSSCLSVGQTEVADGLIYTCINSGGKLTWSAGKSITASLKKTPKPKITGSAIVDQTLKAVPGTWDSGTILNYQWLSNGVPLVGATDISYVPNNADVGSKITVVVTGTKIGYKSAARTATATASVKVAKTIKLATTAEKALPKAKSPTIIGKLLVGTTVKAERGDWGAGVTYSYQWLRDQVGIAGETGINYAISQADAKKNISVSVTGSAKGFKTTTRVSSQYFVSSNLKDLPAVKAFQIKGEPLTNGVLSVASPWASDIDVSFQWLRDGKEIIGATARTYKLLADDEDAMISARVTSFEPGYNQMVVDSLAIGPVSETGLKKFTKFGTPSISGTLSPGATLTLNNLGWDADVTFAIRWLANGSVIDGATSSTYVVKEEDKDRTISAVVTASKTGFQSMDKVAVGGKVIVRNFTSTPSPVVTGIAKDGKTLSVAPSSIDWSAPAQVSLQWLRNGQVISGATSTTYSLLSADVGSVFSVSATGTALGYNTVTKVSSSTDVVVTSTLNGSTPIITGNPIVGQTLTANPVYWEAGVSLSYQWFRGGVAVSGATNPTYALTNLDALTDVSVSVTGRKSDYTDLTYTSVTVAVRTTTLSLTPNPTVLGAGQVGQQLTASTGTWDTGVTFTYQWQKNGVNISGATTATYTPAISDVGVLISVTITGSKSQFTSVTKSSEAITILAGSFTSAPVPSISGVAKLDQTLNLISGTWDSGVAKTYQWLADGVAISGATSTSILLTSAHVGKSITVRVTGTKTGYTTTAKTSAATSAVVVGTFTNQPIPSITGSAMVGKTLVATVGSWDAQTSLSYKWKRNGTAISGATSLSYLVTSADLAATLTFEVTATLAGNLPATKTSTETDAVVASAIAAQGTPLITGTNKVGSTLTGTTGTWDAGVSFTYQWKRNSVAISGATSLSYVLVAADLGASITLTVTGNNGYTSASKTSAATGSIGEGVFLTAPVPSISGSANVGTTLSVSAGTWSPAATISYQWYKAGVAISGATSTTYTIVASDGGSAITVAVTGTRSGYTAKTMTSSATATVTAGTISPSPTPVVSGTPKVGLTLTASVGSWMSGVSLSYAWFKNGTAITGATTSSYISVDGDVGSNISVAVTGTKTGYNSITTTSAGVLILTPPRLPVINSSYSKINLVDVYWSSHPDTSYVFNVVNGAGATVWSYSCVTSACVSKLIVSGLPSSSSAVNYTLNYTATTSGGSLSGSTTISTYPKVNLSVTVNSIVKTGDQYVFNFQAIPNWTYQFNNYNVYDNSNCGVMSSVFSSSPLTVYLPRGTCTMEFIVKDDRGNSTAVPVAANITQVAAPAPALAGTLSSPTATTSTTVDYSLTYSSYFPYYSYNLVILNSAGSVVTPAILPTSARVGDLWSGSKSGTIYFTGLSAGTYTIRADFKSTSDLRYGYDQQASVTLGTVQVAG